MSEEPVVFLEEPVVGRQIRYTDGSHERLSALVTSVEASPYFAGSFAVETEGGEVLNGPCDPAYDPASPVALDASGEVRRFPPDVDKETVALPSGVVHGYNWGAALLPFVWGPVHDVWTGLLGLFPPLAPIVFGVFLARGNLWAWGSGRYADYDDLRQSQGKWVIAGIVWAVVATTLYLCLRDRAPSYY